MLPIVIIPAYQPATPLLELVNNFKQQAPDIKIIIVDDGSTGASQAIFTELTHYDNVDIVRHAVNFGKGQALKTAFNHFLVHYAANHVGVVTADADGQHSITDILHVVQCLQQEPNTLWLGSRQFDTSVPLRSRFGNDLTRKIFKLFTGREVHDTQTGLRGIPRGLLPTLLKIAVSGYDFELDMLIKVVKNNMKVKETIIQTIYIEGNKSSHFNPIWDSLKVYFVFFRYMAVSLFSAGVDFLLFSAFYWFSRNIFGSIVSARILSGILNFALSKTVIFKSNGKARVEAAKYLGLAIFSLLLSYCLVLLLVKLAWFNVYFSKLIADISVFLFNFAMQRWMVFPHKHKTGPSLQ